MYQYLIFVHARETKRIIWTRSTTRAFKISFPKSYHTTLGAYQKVRLDTMFVTHTRNPQIPTGLLPSTTFDLFDFCKTLWSCSAQSDTKDSSHRNKHSQNQNLSWQTQAAAIETAKRKERKKRQKLKPNRSFCTFFKIPYSVQTIEWSIDSPCPFSKIL